MGCSPIWVVPLVLLVATSGTRGHPTAIWVVPLVPLVLLQKRKRYRDTYLLREQGREVSIRRLEQGEQVEQWNNPCGSRCSPCSTLPIVFPLPPIDKGVSCGRTHPAHPAPR